LAITVKPRVLIADDHALLAEGIAGLLRPQYDVIAICTNGRETIVETERLKPDVVTFDIGMPELNGVEVCARIHKSNPSVRLVCVTQQIDLQYLSAVLHSGAGAFVAKQSAANELLLAMTAVMRGKTYITPLLESAYGDMLNARPSMRTHSEREVLTPRQREVLQLIAEGRQSKEIATALNISTKTVEFHRGALMNTLGIRSAAELTRYAIAHGIVH
jgi:DNA-binding NarL/FixJ family response regulator